MDQNVSVKAAKAAGMISLMYLLSRILGFARENLSGRLFNRFETDAFFAAFIIPDTMYYLLVGGALSAAFIPIFTEYLSKGEEEEGWKVASTFINVTVLLLAVFTIFGVLNAKWLAPLEAPDFPPDKMQLLVELTRVMFPAVCFTALAGLMGGVLNSYKRFFAPAFGPIVYNVAIIGGAFFLGEKYGIKGMAAGVVVGAIGNFVTQICFLRKGGGQNYRFGYIDLKNPGFRRMLFLMLPALIGLSATQANLWITNAMASALPEGSITALRFANRLIQLPIGIFAMGIATACFPMLAGYVAEEKLEEFKDMLAGALRSIFFLMLPAGVGLIVLSEPIIKLLFEGQKFTAADTSLTAYALFYYSLAIFAHAAILLLPRAFYALKDTKTPVKISVLAVLLSVLLNYLFLEYTNLGVGGFALSFSIMGLVNMIALMVVLRKRLKGIRGHLILGSFVKTLVAAAVMAVVILGLKPLINLLISDRGFSGHAQAAVVVVSGILFGGATFFVMAFLLKMEEIQTAFAGLKKKLFKNQKRG